MPLTSAISRSGTPYIDGILGGTRWASTDLTYSFPGSASLYGSGYGAGEPANNFGALNTTQQAAVRSALAEYSAVSNLRFTGIAETSSQHADLRFAMSDAPSTALAYSPSKGSEGGDAWFNSSNGYYSNPERGSYAYKAILHEIGHTLGLEHPHESGMPYDRDSMEFSVMSYRAYVGDPMTGGYTNETWGYSQSLMMADIAAIQHLYGANFSSHSGDTTYTWSATSGEAFVNGVGQGAPGGNRVFETVWDGGGVDTYDFSNYANGVTISLEPGAWSTTSAAQLAYLGNGHSAAGTIANALQYRGDARSLIENAVGGSGNDTIKGNTAGNALSGGAGNDNLQGLSGDDRLIGGPGDDVLDGGGGADQAVFSGLRAQYSITLSSGAVRVTDLRTEASDGADVLINTETFVFSDSAHSLYDLFPGSFVAPSPQEDAKISHETMKGNARGNVLKGGNADGEFFGFGGNDRLDGSGGDDLLVGGMGRDVLKGGVGSDWFEFNSAGETGPGAKRDVILDFRRGTDRIDLHEIDADRDTRGNQAFSWVKRTDLDASFTGKDGQLRFDGGILMGDVNGDKQADFHIKISGLLSTADIIL